MLSNDQQNELCGLDMQDGAPCPNVGRNALNLIGRPRLVALDRVYKGPGRIVAKVEYLQPGGSIKDRAAVAIIQDARKHGRLLPGQRVVSMTSGNFGAALAIVCNVLGHPLVITMSAGNSAQRDHMIEALGAELILVPQVNGCPYQKLRAC